MAQQWWQGQQGQQQGKVQYPQYGAAQQPNQSGLQNQTQPFQQFQPATGLQTGQQQQPPTTGYGSFGGTPPPAAAGTPQVPAGQQPADGSGGMPSADPATPAGPNVAPMGNMSQMLQWQQRVNQMNNMLNNPKRPDRDYQGNWRSPVQAGGSMRDHFMAVKDNSPGGAQYEAKKKQREAERDRYQQMINNEMGWMKDQYGGADEMSAAFDNYYQQNLMQPRKAGQAEGQAYHQQEYDMLSALIGGLY